MLTSGTENKIIHLFLSIAEGEGKLSKLKQEIFSAYDINPLQFFFLVDKQNKGYLTKEDLLKYLYKSNIKFTKNFQGIDFVFFFYDKDNDGFLNFYETLDLLVPDSNYFYKKLFKKKYKNRSFDKNDFSKDIDIEIEKCIVQIIIKEIEFGEYLNNIINNIKKYSMGFCLQDVFLEIKSYSFITKESLKAFFDRHQVNYNDKCIKNIFARFDSKKINGKICYNKLKTFFELNNKIKKSFDNYMNRRNSFNDNKYNYQEVVNDFDFDENFKNNNNNFDYNIQDYNKSIPNFYLNKKNKNNYQSNTTRGQINQNQILQHKPLNNKNYDNEDYNCNPEDIQFECEHLSRSGSVESKSKKSIPMFKLKYSKENKNKRNNDGYKHYLREKRTKSLERSLSRSISRSSEISPKQNISKEKISINKINLMGKYNNLVYDQFMDTQSSANSEDINQNLPQRLDRNLIKRKAPERLKKISDSPVKFSSNNYNSFYPCYIPKHKQMIMKKNHKFLDKNNFEFNDKDKNNLRKEVNNYNYFFHQKHHHFKNKSSMDCINYYNKKDEG